MNELQHHADGGNEIRRFINQQLGVTIRIMDRDGNPWFVRNDVCDALDLANPSDATSDFDERDKKGVAITDPLSGEHSRGGGPQNTTVISEPGLYRLIGKSRKPEARAFQDWIYREVLPAIRKTGGYGRPVDLSEILSRLGKIEYILTERLTPKTKRFLNGTPPVDFVRSRILRYVEESGKDGISREIVTNRIRWNVEREEAISQLVGENILWEIVRNRKHFFILNPER